MVVLDAAPVRAEAARLRGLEGLGRDAAPILAFKADR